MVDQLLFESKNVELPYVNDSIPPRHTHILPSLNLGGAERIVCDLAQQWARHAIPVDVIVLRNTATAYDVSGFAGSSVQFHLLGSLDWAQRMKRTAEIILANNVPAYAHLTSHQELLQLWSFGCKTIPVVHNAAVGWPYGPDVWDNENVPWIAACGDVVADDIRKAGYTGIVKVLRHIVPSRNKLSPQRRVAIRHAFGAASGTLLIGMVGRIVPQKRYTRAVSILADLVRRGINARLAIIGAANGKDGETARAAIVQTAIRCGVRDRLSLPGGVIDCAAMIDAFDVVLNTSVFEGVSIVTMEAVAAGVPVVSANVGGQREALSVADTLLNHEHSDTAWGDAILAASKRGGPTENQPNSWLAPVAASRWAWLAQFGPQSPAVAIRPEILFVTANLDVGGAQRSLCNLAAELANAGVAVTVAISGSIGVPEFMTEARAAGAKFVSLRDDKPIGLNERVNRIMALAANIRPTTLCFWNMDPPSKYAIAKILADGAIRLADASPGPMLYHELDNNADLGNRLSMTADSYIASLDVLGAKYSLGLPTHGRAHAKTEVVIPNGVPLYSQPRDATMPHPPANFDPRLAVVCVTRLTDSKHPEMFPIIAQRLGELIPGASLTIVGGVHTEDTRLDALVRKCPSNLFFVGPHHQTQAFLPAFACFMMISEHQGCPNASLEAMASGLAVVANDDGGTREQVIDGVTGRLVSSDNWSNVAYLMADALAEVLSDPDRAAIMGKLGKIRVSKTFSMMKMARSWQQVLLPNVTTKHIESELSMVA